MRKWEKRMKMKMKMRSKTAELLVIIENLMLPELCKEPTEVTEKDGS